MELRAEIKDIQGQLDCLKNKLVGKINSLPQNGSIKPIKGHPSCFTINRVDLLIANWSPEYYDFRCQYQRIIDLIEKADLLNFHNVIDKILKEGKIRSSEQRYTFYFHPEVMVYLNEIFN